jgi:hypothetical protein
MRKRYHDIKNYTNTSILPPPLVYTLPAQLYALLRDWISLGLNLDWLPMAPVFTVELRGITVIFVGSIADLNIFHLSYNSFPGVSC